MANTASRKILVIGGSRFVGRHLVGRLAGAGHRVTVFNRGTRKEDDPEGIDHIRGDRDEGFRISEKFDAVVDMCAYRGEQTKRALAELRFDHFVHMSTAAVYKKSELFPLIEESPIGSWPAWGAYNKDKVECEEVLKKSGVAYASLRPVYILGPENYVDRERFLYHHLKKGTPLFLPGNGQAITQFVFVEEVAESLAILVEQRIAGVFNCAGDDVVTLKGFVEEMARVVGKKPVIEYNLSADGTNHLIEEFPFANENLFVSNAKIKNLGVKFIPLHEGLKRDYEGYYKNTSS